jgi:hypothetical protein
MRIFEKNIADCSMIRAMLRPQAWWSSGGRQLVDSYQLEFHIVIISAQGNSIDTAHAVYGLWFTPRGICPYDVLLLVWRMARTGTDPRLQEAITQPNLD